MSVEKINYNEVKEQLGSSLPQLYRQPVEPIYGEESMNVKDFVIGALVGGIVGAAVGLLLAPKSGRDLRSDVAVQAVNLKEKSVELSSTAKDKTIQLSKQLQEQSSHLVEKVKTLTSSDDNEPTVFDDGTVSSEGEEPLDVIVEAVVDAAVEVEDDAVAKPAPVQL